MSASDPDDPWPPLEVRGWAQEIISCQLQGDCDTQGRLLMEYCASGDGALMTVFLDFLRAAVHIDDPSSADQRFVFAMWLLGDLIEAAAVEGGLAPSELFVAVAGLAASDDLSEEQLVSIRAAQTALVSHIQVRRDARPLGVQRGLSAQDLSDLVAGILILTHACCWMVRERVGDEFLIRYLLPLLVRILEMGADARGQAVSEYTCQLWLALATADCSEGEEPDLP